jgi:hypothetical protein
MNYFNKNQKEDTTTGAFWWTSLLSKVVTARKTRGAVI